MRFPPFFFAAGPRSSLENQVNVLQNLHLQPAERNLYWY
jgi:hypothetical protein